MSVAQNVSDAEVAKKQERVEKLRQQVAEANALRLTREREQQNSITMAQLDAEEARLQAELDAAKAAASVSSVKAGAAPVLDAAKAEKEAAQQQGAAAVSTPTTGEGS